MTTTPDAGGGIVRTLPLMGTSVTIEIVDQLETTVERDHRHAAIDRAFEWFRHVETTCSRFDETSELMQLCKTIDTPVRASAVLFEATRFAVTVAKATGGAFDPTVGARMAARGFNRNYETGARTDAPPAAGGASYADVLIDPEHRTITLKRPLVLDVGAVAKGLAIDLAARELHAFANYAVDAGGDLYVAGSNASGESWSVGIRHPRLEDALIAKVHLSNRAICTSGDYERRSADGSHLLDGRTGEPAAALASVTVIASSAMVADALATAAFALGPDEGLRLLERHKVEGFIVLPSLDCVRTPGWPQ